VRDLEAYRQELVLVGISHRSATIDERERMAAAVRDARAWFVTARVSAPSVAELFVVATCHRFELYAMTDDVTATERELLALVAPAAPAATSDGGWYVRSGHDALLHLARVACGLDSLIVGEAEIAGQVRRAAVQAREAGALGPLLERALAGALRASGRARSETRISRGAMSAASAAVVLASDCLGSLAGRSVLVAGAGPMGRHAIARFARLRPAELFVSSRSEHHAQDAAASTGATIIPLARAPEVAAEVDLLVTALHVAEPVFGAGALRTRAGRPLLAIDLSMPRAIDPAAASLPGVTLKTVDDLGEIARRSAAERAGEIPRVEAIAREEAWRAYRQIECRVRPAAPQRS
jgi:glutamyl-tRNA reductase